MTNETKQALKYDSGSWMIITGLLMLPATKVLGIKHEPTLWGVMIFLGLSMLVGFIQMFVEERYGR